MKVHVVSKVDNNIHAVTRLDQSSYEQQILLASSVRVQPLLITLSSNNLSYARGGDLLRWWDTYPVPAELPQPYNDQKSWGIVPAWGYGLVVESTTNIAPGTILWGFWPTASMTVTLKLEPCEPKGFWTEVSESRQRLMTIYNSYSEELKIKIPESIFETRDWTKLSSLVDEDTLKRLSWISVFRPTWQTGYLLSRHTFTSNPTVRPPIHPLGINLPWTGADADISAAVVVSLAASSKTARSFAYHMFRRDAVKEGPVGLLQVSQRPELLESVPGKLGTAIPAKAMGYDQVGESIEWIGRLRPKKVVVVDFGGRGGALVQFIEGIRAHSILTEVKTSIIQVGSEQKVYSADEITANRDSMKTMGKIQFNTSGVRDAIITHTTAKDFYDQAQLVWDDWISVSHDIVPDIQLMVGHGVGGERGIEKGWSKLCQGMVGTGEGLVYMM
ncbi:hypothetical protein N7481_005007 [Penicillium waksmanii]|uniref:uncharacterized protein n=1 Tax=Penicillium waksmanii TaxID=69791 RepID=UPI002547ED1D|nr:uncharacterized protein N7481_005007 [Penicillium waksmanii]KAJ5982908.1 hypothetical protein N7481_005007 [Penicillium waksmanii]